LILQEYNLDEYKEVDAIHDYKNICIQFGNLSLFVAAVPFLPLLACAKNYLEIRVDGWKLVSGFRYSKIMSDVCVFVCVSGDLHRVLCLLVV
jgi:Calcium-activated chloride channel